MRYSNSQPHDWREWRRMRALDLEQGGWKQREIAAALGVTEGAVSRWLAAARRGGQEALLSHPAPGPAPKLTTGTTRSPTRPPSRAARATPPGLDPGRTTAAARHESS